MIEVPCGKLVKSERYYETHVEKCSHVLCREENMIIQLKKLQNHGNFDIFIHLYGNKRSSV